MPPLNRARRLSAYSREKLCAGAAEILGGCYLSHRTVRALRAMKDNRQIEVARCMVAFGTCADIIVMPLLVATRPRDLSDDGRQRWVTLLLREWRAAADGDIDAFADRLEHAESSAAAGDLELAATRAWLRRLLSRPRFIAYVSREHPATLAQLRSAFEGANARPSKHRRPTFSVRKRDVNARLGPDTSEAK